jgi:hypothetical protein
MKRESTYVGSRSCRRGTLSETHALTFLTALHRTANVRKLILKLRVPAMLEGHAKSNEISWKVAALCERPWRHSGIQNRPAPILMDRHCTVGPDRRLPAIQEYVNPLVCEPGPPNSSQYSIVILSEFRQIEVDS